MPVFDDPGNYPYRYPAYKLALLTEEGGLSIVVFGWQNSLDDPQKVREIFSEVPVNWDNSKMLTMEEVEYPFPAP